MTIPQERTARNVVSFFDIYSAMFTRACSPYIPNKALHSLGLIGRPY